MISSASSALPSIAAPVTPQNNGPSSDDSSSFSDVMQQHQQQTPNSQTNQTITQQPSTNASTSSANQTSTNTSGTTTDDSTPTATAPATPAPAKPAATTVAAGSDLSAMIIQATVLASNLQQAAVAPGAPVAIDATVDTPKATGKVATPTADLSTLIAQATTLLAGTTAKTSGTVTTGKAIKDAGTTTASDSSSTTATTPTDLSALMVQASILGTGGAVTTGINTPTPTTGKAVTGVSTKEKKSSTSDNGGSFLQPGTSASATMATALSLLSTLSNAAVNASVNQTLTSSTGAKNSATSALASVANPLAGTANDEKDKDMNATLTTSATDLLSSTGANQAATSAQPDLQIKLSSSVDFHDALKQVMHVANVTQTTESRTPMRVEMEIQTPPGAIVNIYVSKSGEGLRAQLSTNDPVALAWVQNQMTSLKNTGGLGVDVKWAPPQMETGPQITTSSSQDANLNWNQGGGHSPYQQPDERQQNNREQSADEAEFATAGTTNFMNSLTSAARVA